MMRSGDRNRRIAILRSSTTRNDLNEPIETWPTLLTVWASYEPVSDGEKLRAGEIYADKMARFQILQSTATRTIDPRDRIQYDGSTWDIIGVKSMGFNVGIEITAKARAERV